MMLGPELERKVASWLEIDQNEDTKAELLRLVADGQLDYVDRVLSKRMEFGTAGNQLTDFDCSNLHQHRPSFDYISVSFYFLKPI